jgi:hypothetical protein
VTRLNLGVIVVGVLVVVPDIVVVVEQIGIVCASRVPPTHL